MKKLLLMLFVATLCLSSVPQAAEAGPLCRIGKAAKSVGKRIRNRRRSRGRILRRLFSRRCGK